MLETRTEPQKLVIPSIDVLLGEKRERCDDCTLENLLAKRTRTETKSQTGCNGMKGLCVLDDCAVIDRAANSNTESTAAATIAVSTADKMKLLYETAMEANF